MSLVVCDQVSDGLRQTERTVAVKDIHGHRAFLRVEAGFLTEDGGKFWLPVSKVHEDKDRQIALIELPQEAESGVNRLWVPSSALREYSRTPA
jgi:hypothetical protein